MNLSNIEQIPAIITEALQVLADGKVLASKLTTDPDAIKFITDAEALEAKLKGLVA